MRYEQLKLPYSWEERYPFFLDRVFFIPDYFYEHHNYPIPGFKELFGNLNPISIEFCSGHGHWIIERAKNEPNKNWIAIEKRFDRAKKIYAKLKAHQLSNMLIVCGEAFTFAKFYILSKSIHEIFINFPDPWPKNKHTKHRLMQKEFMTELARILIDCGEVTFVTDDANYLNQTLKNFQSMFHFIPKYPPPYYVNTLDGYGSSYFEILWRKEQKEIYYTQFKLMVNKNLCLHSEH